MRNKFTLTLAVLAGLCSATAALAEKADQSKPIEINANSGTLDQLKGHTVWEGNVVVTQGTLRVNADRVVVTRDDKGNQTVQATGKVVTFRQKMDGKDEYIEGQASRLDYTGVTNTAVLTGNARVKRGEDLVIGDVITYNTQSQTYQVKGGAATGPNKGRITVILQPQTTGQQP